MTKIISEPAVTIDELAIMVQKGFKEQSDELRSFKVEVREEFNGIHGELDGIHAELKSFKAEVHDEFNGIHKDIKDIKRDMATKDDVAELASNMSAIQKTVYKEHGPKIRRLETALQAA